MDEQDTLMALGREMLATCQSKAAIARCPDGRPKCWITRNYILVSIEGTTKRFCIARDIPRRRTSNLQFRLECWLKKNASPETRAITVDESMRFSVGQTEKQLTARELCQKLLSLLCTP